MAIVFFGTSLVLASTTREVGVIERHLSKPIRTRPHRPRQSFPCFERRKIAPNRSRQSFPCFERRRKNAVVYAVSSSSDNFAPPSRNFPRTREDLIFQAQSSVQRALDDRITLLEVYFPSITDVNDAGADQVLDANMVYAWDFLKMFKDKGKRLRVMFPDDGEGVTAKKRWGDNTSFKLSSLDRSITDDDELFVVMNPTWNLKEIYSSEKVWLDSNKRPVIIFNAELEKIRGDIGWPGYPSKDFDNRFLSVVEPAYYVRNLYRGALFRSYPGVWRIYIKVVEGEGTDGLKKELKHLVDLPNRPSLPLVSNLLQRAANGEVITAESATLPLPTTSPFDAIARLFGSGRK